MTHPILAAARRMPQKSSPELPEGSTYDAVAGLWRLDGNLLARELGMISVTKKKDIETGEDVKGT